MGGARSAPGKDEKCIQNFVVKHNGRDQLEDKHEWEGNIEINLKKTGYEIVDWIHLAQDSDWFRTVMDMVINL